MVEVETVAVGVLVAALVVGDSKAPVEVLRAVVVLIAVVVLYLPPLLLGVESGGVDKKGAAAGSDILERSVCGVCGVCEEGEGEEDGESWTDDVVVETTMEEEVEEKEEEMEDVVEEARDPE